MIYTIAAYNYIQSHDVLLCAFSKRQRQAWETRMLQMFAAVCTLTNRTYDMYVSMKYLMLKSRSYCFYYVFSFSSISHWKVRRNVSAEFWSIQQPKYLNLIMKMNVFPFNELFIKIPFQFSFGTVFEYIESCAWHIYYAPLIQKKGRRRT